MTNERLEQVKAQINHGASGNRENITIELLLEIVEELKKINNK